MKPPELVLHNYAAAQPALPVKAVRTPLRLHEIDGIRGWAALTVLIYHMAVELFVRLQPEVNGFIPRLVLHGNMSVSAFFVLSGDALTAAYLSGGKRSLDAMSVKRYFRLTVPILFACVTVWLLMRAGWALNVEAGHVIGREDWLGGCLNFEASFLSMLHYSTYGVYVSHHAKTAYNPFLWTISIELVGSMMVFLYLYIHDKLRRPKLLLITLVLVTLALKSFYSLFFLGVLFGLLRQEGMFDRLREHASWPWIAALGVAACFWFDAMNMVAPGLNGHAAMVLGALMVFFFYSTSFFIQFFSTRLSIFLGNISFSLYLAHFSVLISLTSWLLIRYEDSIHEPMIMAGIAVASIIASIAAAMLMWPLERRFLQRLGRLPVLIFK